MHFSYGLLCVMYMHQAYLHIMCRHTHICKMWVVQTCCGRGSLGNPLLSCPWWSVCDGWQSCCKVLTSTQNQHIQRWPVQTEAPSWRRCTVRRRAPDQISPCQQEIEHSRGKWGLAGWTIGDHIPPGQLYWEHQIALVRVTPEYTEPSKEERKKPSRIELESSSFLQVTLITSWLACALHSLSLHVATASNEV